METGHLKELIITLQRYINQQCLQGLQQTGGYILTCSWDTLGHRRIKPGSDHSSNNEAPAMPHQNVISRNCFGCVRPGYVIQITRSFEGNRKRCSSIRRICH